MTEATQRFSDRAAAYAQSRPGYPDTLALLLRWEGFLPTPGTVADIGSGTGKLTEVFLNLGCTVYAVEPNGPMRSAAEQALGGRSGFVSIDGQAENTGLQDGTADLVAVGQAFHWFDRDRARTEFSRILRPDGAVAVVWNERGTDAGFGAAYAGIVRKYKTGEGEPVNYRSVTPEILEAFFAPNTPRWARFPHRQRLDRDGARARMLSSSYMPGTGREAEAMLAALDAAFDRHAADGTVEIGYEAVMCYGLLACRECL